MEELKQVIESDDNISSYYIQLPKDIAIMIQGYDDDNVWKKAQLIQLIKKLPNEILGIVKLYGRVGAFGNHWDVICDLNDYYKEIELWLVDNTPAFRICGHCGERVEVLPMNGHLRCGYGCESYYPTQPYRKGIYGIYVEDKK